jgi:YD repeat-containing protein
VITQQEVEFKWQADDTSAGFDFFARPVKFRALNGMGDSRSQLTSFYDDYRLWVLGQTERVTEQTTGLQPEAHEFYGPTALRYRSYAFGRLTNTFSYRADGTLQVLQDAANRPTSFQDFSRGLPQKAVFADQSVASHVVNNLGNVASITNEVNTTTRFDFDAMGRVSLITYPQESGLSYHQTQQRFEQVGFEQWGLPSTHWRQTITTGNAIVKRWFDGMWRVVVQQTFDAADETGTSSFVETRFDAAGRKAFQSYPQRSLNGRNNPETPGTEFKYDHLNRVIKQLASSEIGALETTTEYVPGFKRRVTNPRGYATTFSYQAFDTPSEDAIRQIRAPENVTVDIDRDVFGKPLSITRSGSGHGGYKGPSSFSVEPNTHNWSW